MKQLIIHHEGESYTLHVDNNGHYRPKRYNGDGAERGVASHRNIRLMRMLGRKDNGTKERHSYDLSAYMNRSR